MAFRKRSRRFPIIRSRKAPIVPPSNPWDVWLVRASHVAQFGLFLLTAGTIYFTVIPLYQKALLDEQIARREIELSRIQEELDMAYKKIRTYSVSAYVFRVGTECSGLLKLVDQANDGSEESTEFARGSLSISPAECFKEAMGMPALKELRPDDMIFFQAEVSRIGARLEVFRKEALEQYSRAEERARSRLHSIPMEPMNKALAESLLIGRPKDFQRAVLDQIAVVDERMAAESAYNEKLRSEVLNLRNINWPVSEDSDF